MNKKLRAAIIIVVLAGLAYGGYRYYKKNGSEQKEEYRTEKVDRGDVATTVTATGTLSAVTTVQVGSQVSGVIQQLYADFNSPVRKGQLLAELDPTPFQAQVEQRQADVTRATVDLRNSELNFDRQKRLVAAGLTSQAEMDAARASFEGARAQVAQASAALRQSQTNLKYTKIISPIDGVVADRQFDVGQTVAASFQAPTLFTIAQDLTKMQVLADVDQSDIGRVKVGQEARFTVDAYPEEDFVGRISQLRLNATVNQNVVSYPVIIEVTNAQERLRPQMTANVTIEVAKVRDVLRVPSAALRFRPEVAEGGAGTGRGAGAGRQQNGAAGGGSREGFERSAARSGEARGSAGASQAFGQGTQGGRGNRADRGQTVQKLVEGKLVPAKVTSGITDGRFTEIKSGELKEGDVIVVGLATSKVGGQAGSGRPGAPGMPGAGGGGRGGRF